MPKIKVLVVDDHTMVRDGICALLALAADIEVVGEAANGSEALKMVKELEPDVIQQIEDIHNRTLAAKRTEKEASQTGKKFTPKTKRDELFVPLPFELLGNPEFRHFFKRSYLTYAFLRSYIIREPASFDKLNIYQNYFLKGKLASSWSIRKLAEYFDCSPTTIRDQLREMKDKGCFMVVPVPAQKAWDGQQHKIYVFGTHDGNKKETYYIDKAFEMPEVPDGQVVQ